ncbi:MAG: di-trans,poly-cis-decaprenylcistransferase [Gemmatimonadetes bacterium]|nr:di-trans,poly-cis-decaprenylcistransferase [Gemmatimonadota bacterium]
MDGNGRWAKARGRPRAFGHREGARTVRRVCEVAPRLGIGTLTLYAFSADNWKRPASEVTALMALFRRHLRNDLAGEGVRLSVIGRRDRLPAAVLDAIDRAEELTRDCRALHLRLAIDYSAREAILAAARRVAADGDGATLDREEFARLIGEAVHADGPTRDLDLLVRTGGEQRLSDFMLWEAAYAELVFTERMWPDFGHADLAAAMAEYKSRDRRFGTLPQPEQAAG